MFAVLSIYVIFCIPSFGENIQTLFEEVNTTFKLGGKPLHPKLIQEFEPWLSDGIPITVSVDVLAAEGTNEYFESDIEKKGGRYTYRAEENTSYTYTWLGRLQNGLHVLKTADYGGGSGIFVQLLFIKFEISKGVEGALHNDVSINPYDRILMTIVCNYSLEDRYVGKIKLQNQKNKVIIQKEYKQQILDFNNIKL